MTEGCCEDDEDEDEDTKVLNTPAGFTTGSNE
jgi:hypothetical protein